MANKSSFPGLGKALLLFSPKQNLQHHIWLSSRPPLPWISLFNPHSWYFLPLVSTKFLSSYINISHILDYKVFSVFIHLTSMSIYSLKVWSFWYLKLNFWPPGNSIFLTIKIRKWECGPQRSLPALTFNWNCGVLLELLLEEKCIFLCLICATLCLFSSMWAEHCKINAWY